MSIQDYCLSTFLRGNIKDMYYLIWGEHMFQHKVENMYTYMYQYRYLLDKIEHKYCSPHLNKSYSDTKALKYIDFLMAQHKVNNHRCKYHKNNRYDKFRKEIDKLHIHLIYSFYKHLKDNPLHMCICIKITHLHKEYIDLLELCIWGNQKHTANILLMKNLQDLPNQLDKIIDILHCKDIR